MKFELLIRMVMAVGCLLALVCTMLGEAVIPQHWVRNGLFVMVAAVGLAMIVYALYLLFHREKDQSYPAPIRPKAVEEAETWLRERRTECLRFCKVKGNAGVGCTKVGGRPDMPSGYQWPLDSEGHPMQFFMQVRCADLEFVGELRHVGMLYFFGSYTQEGLVLRTAADGLAPLVPPENVFMEEERPMVCYTAIDYPEPWDALPNCTSDEIHQACTHLGDYFYNIREVAQIGGYVHNHLERRSSVADALDVEPSAYEPLLWIRTRMGEFEYGSAQFLIRTSDQSESYFGDVLFDWED